MTFFLTPRLLESCRDGEESTSCCGDVRLGFAHAEMHYGRGDAIEAMAVLVRDCRGDRETSLMRTGSETEEIWMEYRKSRMSIIEGSFNGSIVADATSQKAVSMKMQVHEWGIVPSLWGLLKACTGHVRR